MHSQISVITQSIGMALDNIKSNKMRSFLTMLGIVIGVASVIGLVTIVQSATNNITSQFSELGAGTLTVSAPGTPLNRGLSETDLDLIRNTEGVDNIAQNASMNAYAVYEDEIYKHVSVEGRDAVYFIHNDTKLTTGRLFNPAETKGYTYVAIADKKFVQTVLKGNGTLGTTFLLNGITYKLIGVKGDSNNLSGGFADTSRLDGTLTIPYQNVLKSTKTANVTSLDVYYKDDYDSKRVEANLRVTLDNIFDDADNAYSIFNMDSLMSVMDTIMGMMSTLLGGIASISLLVGGIGIMNMMLVSVSERTKEIGLRKALGAEPSRIQMQFLIESITLSLIGGIIGIILGNIIAAVGAHFMKTDFTISYSAIALGAGYTAPDRKHF